MKIEKVCVNFLAENGVVENGHFRPLKNKRLRCTLAYRVEAYRRSRGELIQLPVSFTELSARGSLPKITR